MPGTPLQNIISPPEKNSSRPIMQPNKQAKRTHTTFETCNQTVDIQNNEITRENNHPPKSKKRRIKET